MPEPLILIALGLAAYRGTQLIVWDSILDGWRGTPTSRLELWYMDGIQPGRNNRFRKFIRDLIGCPYCVGFHVSWLTVAAYHTAFGWRGVSFLSFGLEAFIVAGVQALANRWDDTRPESEKGH